MHLWGGQGGGRSCTQSMSLQVPSLGTGLGGARAARAPTCSHGQVCVLRWARGGHYSLLVFLSI